MGQAPTRSGKRDPRSEPMGPFSPPLPTEAEQQEHKPMAVAMDEKTEHESFLPTTQRLDAYDADVAQRYEQVPGSVEAGRRAHPDRKATSPRGKPETKEMEKHPPGYSETDPRGFKHLEEEP